MVRSTPAILTLGGCDDDVEFEFALDFILDGLDRLQSGNGLDA